MHPDLVASVRLGRRISRTNAVPETVQLFAAVALRNHFEPAKLEVRNTSWWHAHSFQFAIGNGVATHDKYGTLPTAFVILIESLESRYLRRQSKINSAFTQQCINQTKEGQ